MPAEIDLLIVDAFTRTPFAGNPAAVCLLPGERPEGWMAHVAAEMNLSETAFVVPGSPAALRWFTPIAEVSLCGHATLAAAHALWETGRLDPSSEALFHTRSGVLRAARADDVIAIDLPARKLREARLQGDLAACLGGHRPAALLEAQGGPGDRDWLAVLDDEAAVRAIRPDMDRLRRIDAGLIVTAAAGNNPHGWDFVSRYFAPSFGIDEDPVTGAAHCSLIPYWAGRLGLEDLTGFQASARGGVVRGRIRGDRVVLSGHAVTVVRGRLSAAAAG